MESWLLNDVSHVVNVIVHGKAEAARTCDDLQGYVRLGASLLAEPK